MISPSFRQELEHGPTIAEEISEEEEGEPMNKLTVQPEKRRSRSFTNNLESYKSSFRHGRRVAKAIQLCELMIAEKIPHNVYIYAVAIKEHRSRQNIEKVNELFQNLLENAIQLNIYVINSYLFAHTILGDPVTVKSVFYDIRDKYGLQPNAISYRCLIIAYGRDKDREKAREYFNEATAKFGKHTATYNALINALAGATDIHNGAEDVREGKRLIEELKESGLQPNVDTYQALIRLISSVGMLTEAIETIDEGCKHFKPTLAMYDSLFEPLRRIEISDEKLMEQVVFLLKHMIGQSLIPSKKTIEIVVRLFQQKNDANNAFIAFSKLQQAGLVPMANALLTTLSCVEILVEKGCKCPNEALDFVSQTAARLEERGQRLTSEAFCAWINLCKLAGNYDEAVQCWDNALNQITPRSVMTQTIIELHLKHDNLRAAMDVFSQLHRRGLKLRLPFFKPVFAYLVEKDDVYTARMLYDKMIEVDIEPDYELANCLASLQLG